MAIVTSGPFLGFSGTYNGITFYQLNGKTIAKKKNKKRSTVATKGQRRNENDMASLSSHLKAFNSFAGISFRKEAKKRDLNAFNTMRQVQDTKVLMQGELHERSIDFSKLLISKGDLPMPVTSAMQPTEQGVTYTWSTELLAKVTHHTDQVMMLVYFPQAREVVALPAGAQRHVGKDMLVLQGAEKGQIGVVYISFITANGNDVANSKYLGQIEW